MQPIDTKAPIALENECDEFWSEVWDGEPKPLPIYDNEHQDILGGISIAVRYTIQNAGLGQVRHCIVVSDQVEGYLSNYRIPDVVAYLKTNPALNLNTHWTSGPDFLVEVLSPGERAYAKFDFYAKVRTREILLVFRNPWMLELHRLEGETFQMAGRNELGDETVLVSEALPMSFHLTPTATRPAIEIRHTEDGRVWDA